MPVEPPEVINESNLSHAWGRAFLHVLGRNTGNLAPLVVSMAGFTNGLPAEDVEIRRALDAQLETHPRTYSSKVSALTIFPYDTWIRRGSPAVGEFSTFYLEQHLPRLKARDRHNSHGTYFERMIRFQGSKALRGVLHLEARNQLEHIVGIWRRDTEQGHRPRRSALQIAIFDPVKDHTGAVLQGFPCLQQVSLAYDESSNALALNANYPTQYIMDRAYGNYLGLCHLGCFLAREMNLEFSRLNCFIGLPELGNGWRKRDLETLAELVSNRLPQRVEAADAH
jgi:hypothetical protein